MLTSTLGIYQREILGYQLNEIAHIVAVIVTKNSRTCAIMNCQECGFKDIVHSSNVEFLIN